MITTTVYVELLDEGVREWRPVEAERLDDDRYRLVGERPDDEAWPFTTGDVVRCEMRELGGDIILVAYQKAE